MDADLDRIEFGQDDDMRCILVGRRLPFRYGKATFQVCPGSIHIIIKADSLTDKTMNALEAKRSSAWGRFWRAVGGVLRS